MKKIGFFVFLMITIALFVLSIGCSNKKITFISIGSGSLSGVYYPVAGKIAEYVNKKRSKYNIKAIHQSTAGSVFNINAIMSGDMDFGIAQSDRQYQAVKGMAEWQEKGPQTNLRAVCSLHPEMITVVASENSGIYSISDLRGKKVNIGNVGSGHRQNALDVLKNYNINCEEDIYAESVKAGEAPSLIQDERIDAFFYTVGHPNGNLKEATSGRIGVRFIPIDNVDSWIEQYPYFSKAVILKKNYPSALNTNDIITVGVRATFVTSSMVSEEVVYAFTKEIFENIEDLRTFHLALETLTKESMLKGLTAPFHRGTLKYLKEVGLK